MPSLPSTEELRLRLADLMRQAKNLHGDLPDPDARSELRAIGTQIHRATEAVEEEAGEKTSLVVVGMIEAIADQLGQLEGRRGH